eukprot:1236434-Pleurochrysis_carterae.AAC.3
MSDLVAPLQQMLPRGRPTGDLGRICVNLRGALYGSSVAPEAGAVALPGAAVAAARSSRRQTCAAPRRDSGGNCYLLY